MLITAITLDRCVCINCLGFQGFWVVFWLGFFFLGGKGLGLFFFSFGFVFWEGKAFHLPLYWVLFKFCNGFSVLFCSCISYHLGTEMAMSKLSYKSKLLGFWSLKKMLFHSFYGSHIVFQQPVKKIIPTWLTCTQNIFGHSWCSAQSFRQLLLQSKK